VNAQLEALVLALEAVLQARAGEDANRMEALRTLEQVEADVRKLSPQEQAQLRGWLEDLHEDRLELTDSFKAKIEAGKKDIAEGRVRIRRPLQ
jgi:hypothetical protein